MNQETILAQLGVGDRGTSPRCSLKKSRLIRTVDSGLSTADVAAAGSTVQGANLVVMCLDR